MSGVNMFTMPNRIHIGPNPLLTYHFGGVPIVKAHALCSHPHIWVRSQHITLEWAPEFAAELSRRLPVELKQLGIVPDLHDAYIQED